MADNETRVVLDISIKKRLLQRVKNPEDLERNFLGYLYGEILSDKVHIVGCVACRSSHPSAKKGYPAIPDWKNERSELSCLVPNGINLCGIYYSCTKPTPLEAHELKKVFDGLWTNDISFRRTLVVLQHCSTSESDSKRCFIYDKDSGTVTQCEYQEADIIGEFLDQRISFRLQANIPICISRGQNDTSEITNKIEKSCKELDSTSTVFHVKDCKVLLKNQDIKSDNLENCEALLVKIESDPGKIQNLHGSAKSKGKQKSGKVVSSGNAAKFKDALDVRYLSQLTDAVSNHETFVPVFQYKKAVSSQIKFTLAIDTVLNVSMDTSLASLPKLFISAMCSQLRKMASAMTQFSKEDLLTVVKVYHFKLPGFCHLVTTVYPTATRDGVMIDDNELASYRLELHKRLLLPENRPLMRPSNKYVFENERQQDIYLTNPHTGLVGGVCGTVAVVDGTYGYHHYMQDNFNDDGWGCAYRSLQTIASWFRHQGYTSKPVPSHREIQQALVDLQDKGEEFVGSRQWIGSFEVSMCLEHLLGVTSKIMFVSTGAEMRAKGRDLLHHFQTQGTPIMIGGGVLAHTILGVDFNDQTGDIRFLILDPHYTGGEDLKVILDKGWCGWKGPDFWNQQVHYNMCMPQRPDMI
ncbi:ufm1-specific protease 2-like isoform X2 [Orbicella faveolata]|uniref:ufm1-specific protease 2-like isoform X2 n=1 Tax=Orbicella faveolata TaxID=48498 RepID=UPI0009E597C8|nr:ufm1-specific protease 2-like isoform X2 [Orbicella faveolata]